MGPKQSWVASNCFLDIHHLEPGALTPERWQVHMLKILPVQGKIRCKLYQLLGWSGTRNCYVFVWSALHSLAVIHTHTEAHGLIPSKVEELHRDNKFWSVFQRTAVTPVSFFSSFKVLRCDWQRKVKSGAFPLCSLRQWCLDFFQQLFTQYQAQSASFLLGRSRCRVLIPTLKSFPFTSWLIPKPVSVTDTRHAYLPARYLSNLPSFWSKFNRIWNQISNHRMDWSWMSAHLHDRLTFIYQIAIHLLLAWSLSSSSFFL